MRHASSLGLLLCLTAGSPAKAANNGQFAQLPFLLKFRGGAPTRTLAKSDEPPPVVAAPISQKATLTKEEEPLIEDIQLLSDKHAK